MFAYEGNLRIRFVQSESLTKPATYAVTFAPYHGHGGALKPLICYGEGRLVNLLQEIGISRVEIEKAVTDLHQSNAVSIQRVVLNAEELDRYGLGEAGIAESIRKYLEVLST